MHLERRLFDQVMSWSSPPPNFIKMNKACNPNSITRSLGCIIKDNPGYLIGGESRFNLHSSSSKERVRLFLWLPC